MDCAMGATPLVLACRLGRVEQVTILLECPSVLVNTRDASGLTPLMRKAILMPSKDSWAYTLFPQLSTYTDAVHGRSLRIVSALVSLSHFTITRVYLVECVRTSSHACQLPTVFSSRGGA
jgi:hypothetical protein